MIPAFGTNMYLWLRRIMPIASGLVLHNIIQQLKKLRLNDRGFLH